MPARARGSPPSRRSGRGGREPASYGSCHRRAAQRLRTERVDRLLLTQTLLSNLSIFSFESVEILMCAIKLSICIPTYDRARFVERTLERLASWTLPFPHESYEVDKDFVLPRRDFGAALAFISERIAFPENGVYRASALRVSWAPRYFAFWAFSHFAHYLDQGDVAFLRNPFYRYILNSRIDHGANSAGFVETMTAWDRYRGGLEYLVYFGVKRGAIAGTHETRRYYDDMIQKVVVDRMVMAQKLWVSRKGFLNACELYARLVFAGSENHPLLLALRDKIRPWATAQTLAWFVNTTAGIRRLVIANISNAEQLSDSLRQLGLRREITIDVHRALSPPPQLHTVVLVRLSADREPFVAMGYEPNLVLCWKDLLDTLLV
jgi:hypothetical protein